VKGKILDPGARLLPEMSATANFLQSARSDAELHEPPRMWLPMSAVADGRVAVIDGAKHVTRRRVTTGIKRENRIEITSGVREGERVVTQNPNQLRDGQLVRLNE